MKETSRSIAPSLSTWAAFSSVVAVTACAGGAPEQAAPEATAQVESALAGEPTKLFLAIDGLDKLTSSAGWIMSVEGGNATSDVVTNKVADGNPFVIDGLDKASPDGFFARKNIGAGFQEVAVKVSPRDVTPALGAWISDFLSGRATPRSGALVACTADLTACEESSFVSARITEVGFPATDGASKDAAFMTLKFSPWITRNKKGDGSVVQGTSSTSQKMWAPSDFKFTVDGVDVKASKVDGLTVKQSVPGKLEFPALKVTVPDQWADPVRKGGSPRQAGVMTFLDTLGGAFFTLRCDGLTRLTSSSPRSNNEDKIASVVVEMYCENITSKFN